MKEAIKRKALKLADNDYHIIGPIFVEVFVQFVHILHANDMSYCFLMLFVNIL